MNMKKYHQIYYFEYIMGRRRRLSRGIEGAGGRRRRLNRGIEGAGGRRRRPVDRGVLGGEGDRNLARWDSDRDGGGSRSSVHEI